MEFDLRFLQPVEGVKFGLSVYRRDGDWVIGQTSNEEGATWAGGSAGDNARGSIVLRNLMLGPGDYVACLAAYGHDFTICLALTELNLAFKVRAPYPTWGKIIHPIEWRPA